MTSEKLGLNYHVLRTFYIACIRSLIDYAAISILTSNEKAISQLEIFQNEALRIMLKAPRWTKLVNLRQETDLVPIRVRIQQLCAAYMCKSLRSGRLEDLNEEVLRCLQQRQNDEDGVPVSPYAAQMAQCLLDMGITLQEAQTQDRPHPDYSTPPSWEEKPFNAVHITNVAKKRLTNNEKRGIVAAVSRLASRPGHVSIFTDGSVDPDAGTAACAFTTSGATASYRLSDGSSTLQAELAGMCKALQYALSTNDGTNVTLFTDSRAAILLLHHRDYSDNVQLCTSVLHTMQQLRGQGRTVELVWIPSHINIPSNEAADAAANEGLMLPRATIHVAPSTSSLRCSIRRTAFALAAGQHRAEVLRSSRSAVWYSVATELQRPCIPASMPRRTSSLVHRLRLGYPCWEEIRGEARVCEYCDAVPDEPLAHYLLHCPATDRLRQVIGYTGGQAADDVTRQAAQVARQLVASQAALDIAVFFPPPR